VWSSSTWTAPSVISLFTGQHVREHGWDEGSGSPRGLPPLPAIPTLAEVLSEHGFATAGIHANPLLGSKIGFARGFERWERQSDAAMPDNVARELEGWRDGRRHFLYLHLMGPHAALNPSTRARRRWNLDREIGETHLSLKWVRRRRPAEQALWATEVYREAYQAVIEDTDLHLGRIIAALEPYLDETVVVVTSDHGEMLGERGRFGHSAGIDEALTRVPLIAIHVGPLPDRMTIAAIPDVITAALGIEHEWAVQAGGEDGLVAQREGRFALSPDGRAKGVWLPNGRLSIVDLAGYPEEQPGMTERAAEIRDARKRFEARVERGSVGDADFLTDPATTRALIELGYLDAPEPD